MEKDDRKWLIEKLTKLDDIRDREQALKKYQEIYNETPPPFNRAKANSWLRIYVDGK